MATKANLTKSTQAPTATSRGRRANPAKTKSTAISADTSAELLVAHHLPSPATLAEYEKIVPGGAARLLELAEAHAIQERELERKTTEAKIALAKFKQAAHFILALTAGVFGGLLLLNGSELAGLLIILIDAAVIASSIIYGKSDRS